MKVRVWLRLSCRNGSGERSRTGIAAGIRCSTIAAAEQAASVTSRWAPQDEAFAFAFVRHGNGIFHHGMPTVCCPHRQVVTARSASNTRSVKAECESGVQKRRVTTTCARGVRRRRVQTVCTRRPRREQAGEMSWLFLLPVGVQTPRAQVARAGGVCRWRAAMACSDGVQPRRARSARDYRPANLRVISLGWVSRSCGHGKHGAGRTQRVGLAGARR